MNTINKELLVNILRGRCSVFGDVRVQNDFVIHVKLDKKSVLEQLEFYDDDNKIDAYIDGKGNVQLG